MHTPPDEQSEGIVHHLRLLNRQVRQQMSMWFVFRNGIIYGIGFVVGSTILTAIVVSVVLKFFSNTVLADVILWIAHAR